MDYNVRIDDNFLKADHSDGEVLQHTDLNELESVVKTAINANYIDIQKLQDGTKSVSEATSLKGEDGSATLSQFITEMLQPSDNKIPTSLQVKNFVENAINTANTGLVFYWDGTGGQEGANIFNQICSKYDNGGKFVFYGRCVLDASYINTDGEYVERKRDVIAPIMVSKLDDTQTGNVDVFSFSIPPVFLGDKYAICSIQLTGEWGKFTDVSQVSWGDDMAPARVQDVKDLSSPLYEITLEGDYTSESYPAEVVITDEDAVAIENVTFALDAGKLVNLKVNIGGNVNMLGTLTTSEITGDDLNDYYAQIDLMSLGQNANYKVTIKLHFVNTEGVTWENDTDYTKMYISTM